MPKPSKSAPKKAAPEKSAKPGGGAGTRYRPHPLLARERSTVDRLAKETGKSLAQWIALARKGGPPKEKACAAWLEEQNGLGAMQAMWVAHYAWTDDSPADYQDPVRLVDALYSGPRAALRSVHEAVVDAAIAAGDEAIVTSCKTMVPVYRKHVFAEMRPVEDAVEVQLALGDVPAKGRLEKSDGRAPGDRLTHRILVRGAGDVDAEFKGWMAQAYANGATAMSRGATDIETPPDVEKALKASKPATATWAACTPAMRRDFIQWIVSAKQEETRARRIAQAVEKLASGKRRMY